MLNSIHINYKDLEKKTCRQIIMVSYTGHISICVFHKMRSKKKNVFVYLSQSFTLLPYRPTGLRICDTSVAIYVSKKHVTPYNHICITFTV